MGLAGRELILAVTGSIAAYKAAYLLRELRRAEAGVTVVMTAHSREFVTPLTFRTLSGRPVLTDLFDPQEPAAVEHVALAERADLTVVAPATAHALARAALGLADDFLGTRAPRRPRPGALRPGHGRRHVGAPGGPGARGNLASPRRHRAGARSRRPRLWSPGPGPVPRDPGHRGGRRAPALAAAATSPPTTSSSRPGPRGSRSIPSATSPIARRAAWGTRSRRRPRGEGRR